MRAVSIQLRSSPGVAGGEIRVENRGRAEGSANGLAGLQQADATGVHIGSSAGQTRRGGIDHDIAASHHSDQRRLLVATAAGDAGALRLAPIRGLSLQRDSPLGTPDR